MAPFKRMSSPGQDQFIEDVSRRGKSQHPHMQKWRALHDEFVITQVDAAFENDKGQGVLLTGLRAHAIISDDVLDAALYAMENYAQTTTRSGASGQTNSGKRESRYRK